MYLVELMDLTFASQSLGQRGCECQIRSTRIAETGAGNSSSVTIV